MLAWLIVATLAWGGLATFTAYQHTSGAATVVSASEPLTYDALQIWQSLSDANDAAGAAVLSGALPSPQVLGQYTTDINTAKLDIADAAARGAPMGDIKALQLGLTSYTDEVSKAQANDLLGLPVGAAYFRQASNQMTSHLLPAAHDLYTREDARLATASAQATGLPLIACTILAAIALGYAYYRCGRWLTGRTHRVLNGGLALAGVVGTVTLLWLAGAFLVGRADLLASQAQGSTPVMALANADIAALKAHTDEALTLINNSGDDSSQGNFLTLEKELGPGPGTLLAQAQSAAAGRRPPPTPQTPSQRRPPGSPRTRPSASMMTATTRRSPATGPTRRRLPWCSAVVRRGARSRGCQATSTAGSRRTTRPSRPRRAVARTRSAAWCLASSWPRW